MDLRAEAKRCLDRARRLLDAGDDASVRYACLELRFALEFSTVAQLEACLRGLDPNVAKKWRVQDLMRDLLDADPNAGKTRTIAIGRQAAQGVPAEQMSVVGTDTRLSADTVIDHCHALGSFLHPPTLARMLSDDVTPPSKMRRKAEAVVSLLRPVLESSVFSSIVPILEFECDECGAGVVVNVNVARARGEASCRGCGAEYWMVDHEGRTKARLKWSSLACGACKTDITVPTHRVTRQERIECPCGAAYEFRCSYAPVKATRG